MRSAPFVLVPFALSAALCTTARAQDAGVPCVGGGPDGGTITYEGECQKDNPSEVDFDNAVYCTDQVPADGTVEVINCGSFQVGAQTIQGTCEIVDSSFGAWCTFPDNAPCAFSSPGGNVFFACGLPEWRTDRVCDVFDGCSAVGFAEALCIVGFPECLSNNRLRVNCTAWGQAITVGCAERGGACIDDVDRGPICLGPVGARCDDVYMFCENGLNCTNNACVDPNAPPDAGFPDAGFPDAGFPDAGPSEGEGEGEGEGDGEGEGEGDGEGEGEGEGEVEGDGDPGDGVTLGPGRDVAADEPEVIDDGGCGCGSAARADLAALAIVLFLARRRR